MIVELKVSLHPSGNRTLMERKPNSQWADVLEPEGVLASSNTAHFYRVTAKFIAKLSNEGFRVQLQDTQLG